MRHMGVKRIDDDRVEGGGGSIWLDLQFSKAYKNIHCLCVFVLFSVLFLFLTQACCVCVCFFLQFLRL